jgi:hypothetical protein
MLAISGSASGGRHRGEPVQLDGEHASRPRAVQPPYRKQLLSLERDGLRAALLVVRG